MTKRIIAILLCLVTLASVCLFTGCGSSDDDGAYITMYLTDELYDFDPANAYCNNDTYNVVSMLFDTLFRLDSNGKIVKSLVKEYEFIDDTAKGEYKLVMTLNETYWSDGDRVKADDVVFAWQRIMNWESSYECASLLYDLKNARAVKEGNLSIDRLGVKATADYEVTVEFEAPVDHNAFLLNLTSVALTPLKDRAVNYKGEQYDDWAKKPGFATNGAFKLSKAVYQNSEKQDDPTLAVYYYDTNATPFEGGKVIAREYPESKLQYFILERNAYYYRDRDKDAVDVSVTPARIICDCTRTDAEIMEAYRAGEIHYVGEIPYAVRSDEAYADLLKKVRVTDALSTFVLNVNENAIVPYSNVTLNIDGTVKLFDKTGKAIKYDSYRFVTDDENKTVLEIKSGLTTKQYEKVYNSDKSLLRFDANGFIYGEKILAKTEVRQALSLSIDREAIADAVVYADAANGFVSTGVFETNYKTGKTFRDAAGSVISTSADLTAAKEKLTAAGIDPANYTLTLTVNVNDDVHVAIGEMIAAVWGKDGLGFDVTLSKIGAVVNNDFYVATASTPGDFGDDLIIEAIADGNYQVIGYDNCAYSADAFSQLAPYATAFSGNGVLTTDIDKGEDEIPDHTYSLIGHKSGYESEEYNMLIEAAWYLQYFANISEKNYESFGYSDPTLPVSTRETTGKANFAAHLAEVKAVYDKYGISTTSNLSAGREQLLMEAEKLLLSDAAVIPVIYNKNAVLIAGDLKNTDLNSYYTVALFSKANLKNYQQYLEELAEKY